MGTPGPGLPSHAPVVDRPTLQLLLGSVPEGELGAFGSAERRTAESGLIAGFLQQYGPHLARGGPLRPGQEGSQDMGWLVSFGEGDEHTQIRLGMVDAGAVDVHIPGRALAISVRVRQGPPRLSSRWVRVIVSGLHEDFMIPGVISTLLESAGYVAGGEEGFVLRAEHAGEHGGEIAAIAPGLGRCGVIVGIVRPPATDRTLSRLPKNLQDFSGGGAARIRVSHHSPGVPPPTPPAPPPQAVPAAFPDPVQDTRAGSQRGDLAPPPPHLPLPTPPQPPFWGEGNTHPAITFQPSPHHLPFPPPPPPPRRMPPDFFQSQRRGAAFPLAHLFHPQLAFSPGPSQTRTPRGFVPAVQPHPSGLQGTSSFRLTTALDPILDLGGHLPGDVRGIGRFPSPPPGPVPFIQRGFVDGTEHSGGIFPRQDLGAIGEARVADTHMADADSVDGAGASGMVPARRVLGAIGDGRAADTLMAEAGSVSAGDSGRGSARRDLGTAGGSGRGSHRQDLGAIGDGMAADTHMTDTEAPRGRGFGRGLGARLTPPPGFPAAIPGDPMEIDGVMVRPIAGLASLRREGMSAAPDRVLAPGGGSAAQDVAGPSRMDIDLPSARPLLPDTPLVDTCMAWLADNEDPGRTIDERRRHIYRLVQEYPSVYTRHAQDGSNPPPPEVRTALRDIGGLLAADGSDDPAPSLPPSPPSSSPPQQPHPSPTPPGRRRHRGQGNPRRTPVRRDGPAASAGRRSRQPADPWHSSSRLPRTSTSQPQTQPSTALPSGSRRRSQ